ncbi:MAG TPA: PAS domain S-box protein [Dehalococcoidia bacterium]
MPIEAQASSQGRDVNGQGSHLAAQYHISSLLSEAADLTALRPAVLESVCRDLGWQAGAWWDLDEDELSCSAFWAPRNDYPAFRAATEAATLGMGLGLPGSVAQSAAGRGFDLATVERFARGDAAQAESLRGAFAFPMTVRGRVLGVLEFFRSAPQQPSEEMLEAMTAVGGQLGLFIERWQAEEELRASEEQYRRLVEASPEPIAVHQDGRFVFVNQATANLLGAPNQEVLLGRAVLDFIHKDFQPVVLERIRRVLEERITADLIEEKFVRLDGEIIDVEVMAIWTRFGGKPAYQIMARDITERKRAQTEQQEAEERYRNLFENAVFGVFRSTPDGRFISANNSLARMFGYETPAELIITVSDIGAQIHRDPERRSEFVRRLESEGFVGGFEAVARRRDGSPIAIALSGRKVLGADGKTVAYEGIVEDITLRRQAEDLLREQKRVLETIEQVGASIASELELDRTVQAVTDAATELTGAQFGAFLYKAVDDEGVERAQVAISRGERAGGDMATAELNPSDFAEALEGTGISRVDDARDDPRYQAVGRKLGRLRSYLAVPVLSRRGSVIGGLFFGHERPRVFSEHHEALASGIARWAGIALDNATLYADSQHIQEELRQANEAKDEFLGLVSHELRTPITTIYGGARILQSRAAQLSQDRKDMVLTDIEQESERLYRLVEDLLALARLELGATLMLRPVSFQRAAERVLAAFAKRHQGREVAVDIPNDLPPIEAEQTYVEQVLHNLLGNADKYSPTDQPIEVRAHSDADELTVEVLDRGPGLSQEEIERVFERFYRSEKTARQAGGLGIGLTVCKRLIEAQNGTLTASPREGGGLRMTFTIPVAKESFSELP